MGYKQLTLPKNMKDFPKGLILISGKNSYGKSTILEGILFAFFGPKIFRGRTAASFITYGESKAELTVYFTVDNKKYNIYRKWSRSGATSPKLFEWVKSTYREVKKFDIEKFFEISTEQALNTVFVRQGEVEDLASKKGAELREMIINLFRLNIIDDALVFLDKESKDAKFKKEKLEKRLVPLDRIEKDITIVELETTELEKKFVENIKAKKEYEQQISDFPSDDLISKLGSLYDQQKIIEENSLSYKNDFQQKIKNTKLNIKDFEPLSKINERISLLINEESDIKSQKEILDKRREATYKGLGKTKGRIDDSKKKIKKMEDSLLFTTNENNAEVAQCPTCQNELTKEHYNEMVNEFNKEIEISQEKVKSITKVIENLDLDINEKQNKLDNVKKQITVIQGLRNDYQNYQKKALDFDKAKDRTNIFLAEHKSKFSDCNPANIKMLSIEKKTLNTELAAIIKELKVNQKKIEDNLKRITDLNEEIKYMNNLEKDIGEFEIEIEHINKAKEFVRRFVTEYMVVKRLVKNIAMMTNKYIKDFTSGQYSDLHLDLVGTKKTGLSLKIRDNFNGVHESVEVLSGGDKTALGIALRLAISELMSKIRPTKESPKKNPKIDILLLDEPLAALDETRRERILKHLIKSKTFSQIFLITHTSIPSDINTHKIIVSKDHTTGISTAIFQLEETMLNPLLNS
jgi:exonuclease SbcC